MLTLFMTITKNAVPQRIDLDTKKLRKQARASTGLRGQLWQ